MPMCPEGDQNPKRNTLAMADPEIWQLHKNTSPSWVEDQKKGHQLFESFLTHSNKFTH